MLVPVNLLSMLLVSRIMLLYACSSELGVHACSIQKLVAMSIKVLTSFCPEFCFAYVS
jgi:hypothetical protein